MFLCKNLLFYCNFHFFHFYLLILVIYLYYRNLFEFWDMRKKNFLFLLQFFLKIMKGNLIFHPIRLMIMIDKNNFRQCYNLDLSHLYLIFLLLLIKFFPLLLCYLMILLLYFENFHHLLLLINSHLLFLFLTSFLDLLHN